MIVLRQAARGSSGAAAFHSVSAWPAAAVAALVAGCTLPIAALRPFWHDELYTFSVSRQPAASAVWNALLSGADNHAPFDYIIRHFFLQLPGPVELISRLPSVIAFAVFCACMFLFVRRRAGLTVALAAAFLPLTTRALWHAAEARPYAPLLGLAGICMLAWQSLHGSRRLALNTAILSVSLAVAVNMHYYGVLLYPAVLCAELFLWWWQKRIRWSVVAAVACSLPALLIVLPFARAASAYSRNFWTPLRPDTIPQAYATLFGLATLLILGVAALLAVQPKSSPDAETDLRIDDGRTCDMCLAVAMLATILFSYLLAIFVTRAFHYRYALIALAGLSTLLPLLVARYVRNKTGQRLLLLATILLAMLNVGMSLRPREWRNGSVAEMQSKLATVLAAGDGPVVWGDIIECLPLAHYAPHTARGRIYCLAAPESTHTLIHAAAGLAPWTHLPVRNASDFLREHPTFVLAQRDQFLIEDELDCGPDRKRPGKVRFAVCTTVAEKAAQ
jgi:hypothetical protein